MFVIRALWGIFALVQIESQLQDMYFKQENLKVNIKEAMKEIPSSSMVACAMACQSHPKCKTSGISKDRTCFLFEKKVLTDEKEGVSMTLCKEERVIGPNSKGRILRLLHCKALLEIIHSIFSKKPPKVFSTQRFLKIW